MKKNILLFCCLMVFLFKGNTQAEEHKKINGTWMVRELKTITVNDENKQDITIKKIDSTSSHYISVVLKYDNLPSTYNMAIFDGYTDGQDGFIVLEFIKNSKGIFIEKSKKHLSLNIIIEQPSELEFEIISNLAVSENRKNPKLTKRYKCFRTS